MTIFVIHRIANRMRQFPVQSNGQNCLSSWKCPLTLFCSKGCKSCTITDLEEGVSLEQGESFKMGFRSFLQLTKKAVAETNMGTMRFCNCNRHFRNRQVLNGLAGTKVEPAKGTLPCGSQGGENP